jgi:hypothetical protein
MYMNAIGTPRTCCNPEIFQVDINNINLLCTLHVYGCILWGNPAYRAPKLLHTMRIYDTMYMNAIGTPRTRFNAVKYHVDIHNVTLLCTLHVYGSTSWDHPAHRAPKHLHTMRIYHTMYISPVAHREHAAMPRYTMLTLIMLTCCAPYMYMGAPYETTLHIERPSSCTRCGYIIRCI